MMLQHRTKNYSHSSPPIDGNGNNVIFTSASYSESISSITLNAGTLPAGDKGSISNSSANAPQHPSISNSQAQNDPTRMTAASKTTTSSLVDDKGHILINNMITDEDGEDREKGFHIPYINFYLLSEREADYLLALSTPLHLKLMFICTNLPYFIMAFGVLAQKQVKEHAYPEFMAGVCSFPLTYFIFAIAIATTSTILHSSQMRMGLVCCRRKYADIFHRRTVQDLFDVADCSCATLAVVAVISCQYNSNIFNMMVLIVPLFFSSILAKKLQRWNLYVITHGLWHLGTAAILWDVVMPELESLGW